MKINEYMRMERLRSAEDEHQYMRIANLSRSYEYMRIADLLRSYEKGDFMRKTLKGVEMPVNTIMILLIATLITLAIILLFSGVFKPGERSLNIEIIKSENCMKFCGGSKAEDIGITIGEEQKYFDDFCYKYYSRDCSKVCGCAGP